MSIFFSLFESIDIATRPLFLCFSDLPCVKIISCSNYISLLKIFVLCSNDKLLIEIRFQSGINITSKGWSLIYLNIVEFQIKDKVLKITVLERPAIRNINTQNM